MKIIQSDEYNKQTKQDNVIFPTLINSYSKIAGDICLTTDVRVDGTVYGVIETEKNIYIGTNGYVKGVLRAKNLVSFGRIEGSVIISGISIFHPSSSFFGTLFTKDINVIQGAALSAHIVTYDKLDPIYEAQICLDEERTRSYSYKVKAAISSHNSITAVSSINQSVVDKEPDIQKGEQEEENILETVYLGINSHQEINGLKVTSVEANWNDVGEENKGLDITEQQLLKIEKEAESLIKNNAPEKNTLDREIVFETKKNDISSQPMIENRRKDKDSTTDQSLVFESLLKTSFVENSDLLFNEVEKLNLASMEFLPNKENQRKEKNFLDRLFQFKPKTSSK